MAPPLPKILRKIILAAKVVQLPEIQVICPQPPQAIVEQPQGPIVAAIVGLGGQEDLRTVLTQGQAVVVDAAGVSGGRLEVVDALLEGTLDDGDGLGLTAVGSQNTLAAQAEDRDGLTGATEKAAWNGCGRWVRVG